MKAAAVLQLSGRELSFETDPYPRNKGGVAADLKDLARWVTVCTSSARNVNTVAYSMVSVV